MRYLITALSLILILGTTGCKDSKTEDKKSTENPGSQTITFETDPSEKEVGKITDDQALSAIKNYCHTNNPDLKDIEEAGEYPVYWEVESSDDKEIVILFRSYTGAEVRYYVNRASGDTYVTEFVQGINSEEEKTNESFNVKDYLTSSISGTWATASMGYEYKGEFLPEYHVRFTDSEVNYGHIINDTFEPDHSNIIVSIQEIAPGRYRIQAQTSSGGQYTYQTDENEPDILNYYETWNESDFPDAYRGGSSLTRID